MKGMVQVYTGNGKGKTTAALGLSIRALGAGKRVLFLQFMKSKEYSEHKMIAKLSPEMEMHCIGKPFFIAVEGSITNEEMERWGDKVVIFPPGQPPKEYVEIIAVGLEMARNAVASGVYDLVVLDEIICAQSFGLISLNDLLDLINIKAPDTELVLTGRGASRELIKRADLVTEMKEVKHYYTTQGLEARLGIEN